MGSMWVIFILTAAAGSGMPRLFRGDLRLDRPLEVGIDLHTGPLGPQQTVQCLLVFPQGEQHQGQVVEGVAVARVQSDGFLVLGGGVDQLAQAIEGIAMDIEVLGRNFEGRGDRRAQSRVDYLDAPVNFIGCRRRAAFGSAGKIVQDLPLLILQILPLLAKPIQVLLVCKGAELGDGNVVLLGVEDQGQRLGKILPLELDLGHHEGGIRVFRHDRQGLQEFLLRLVQVALCELLFTVEVERVGSFKVLDHLFFFHVEILLGEQWQSQQRHPQNAEDNTRNRPNFILLHGTPPMGLKTFHYTPFNSILH